MLDFNIDFHYQQLYTFLTKRISKGLTMSEVLVFAIIAGAVCYIIYKLKNSAKTGKCSGGCGCGKTKQADSNCKD